MASHALASSYRPPRRLFVRARGIAAVLGVASALLEPHALVAQVAASLVGQVVLDGVPAPDVAVFLIGTTRGATTGGDGRYRIAGIAPGRYTVAAQRVGVATRKFAIALGEGESLTLDVALESSAIMIAPMTVSATRELRHRDEGSVTIDFLDGAEVRRTHAAHPS
jgi:hypothetical protein